MSQYIYTMNGVSKVVPPKRQIIKDISLSFFPGAKIGLLGLNGAGKSTVLKIMAGVDTDFVGEARPRQALLQVSQHRVRNLNLERNDRLCRRPRSRALGVDRLNERKKGRHQQTSGDEPNTAEMHLQTSVAVSASARLSRHCAAGTGSIFRRAPASSSVSRYKSPSGPCRTSRIRCLSSVSID
jgi:ATPase subunit of ABC transporter with duplicated ATPase domains